MRRKLHFSYHAHNLDKCQSSEEECVQPACHSYTISGNNNNNNNNNNNMFRVYV